MNRYQIVYQPNQPQSQPWEKVISARNKQHAKEKIMTEEEIPESAIINISVYNIYHVPTLHYFVSKGGDDDYENGYWEYTDNQEEAIGICLYVQIRNKNTHDLIDGGDEVDFPNTDEGYEKAIALAEEWSKRPGFVEYQFD